MNLKHGMRYTKTYRAWIAMRARCFSRRHQAYDRYGGRGITVCPRWNDFAAFLADIGECPVGYSLERINNAKGYEPENCRWATPTAQANNRRNNHLLTHNGVTMTVAQWAKEMNLTGSPGKLHSRIRRGWPITKALTN